MNTSALAVIAAHPDNLRYSLQALLASLPQIKSVQCVEDAPALIATVTTWQPRLIVLDIDLAGAAAHQVLTRIKTIAPHTRSVVLIDRIEQRHDLQAGSIDLVLLKGYPAAELFASVERLLSQDDETTMFVDSGG